MAVETSERFDHTSKNYLYRDQIITKEDLKAFRIELLNDLKQQFSSHIPSKPKQWLKSSEVRKILKISPGTSKPSHQWHAPLHQNRGHHLLQ
jgi:phospholipase C